MNRPDLGGQPIGADLFEPFVTQGREVYPNPQKIARIRYNRRVAGLLLGVEDTR